MTESATALGEPPVLAHLVKEIEDDLAQRVAAVDGPAPLRDAVEYAVLGGGKRLRPVLTLISCEAVGGRRADAIAAAAAMELIHCFSLVHDDLPAMDDDQVRRGQPTLHVQAGEAMAILAGDVMMSLAFEWIATCGLPGETVRRVASSLSEATTAMIAGQVYDTLGGFPSGLSDAEKLDLVHRHKTGALIRAACRMGGICGGANESGLLALTSYGESVGTMFQVVDDLLDVTQTAEHIGKATGKDHEAGKLTWPGVHGVEASRREVERLRLAANQAIEPLGTTAAPLRELCDYMAVRTK